MIQDNRITIIPRIYQTAQADFGTMVDQLLNVYVAIGVPIRLIFFASSSNNSTYMQQFAKLKEKVGCYFPAHTPLVSYVAQPVAGDGMVMEVHEVKVPPTAVVYYGYQVNLPYITIASDSYKYMFLSGIVGNVLQDSIRMQALSVFQQVSNLLKEEGFSVSDIIRQWNYIEHITQYDADGHQHYQDFNEVRSHFYADAVWENGYPAATGIGTECGGVMVDMDLLQCDERVCQIDKVDNPCQVAAYQYSQSMLLGKSDFGQKETPKFERAKMVWRQGEGLIYLSGTAAISGEVSIEAQEVVKQLDMTLNNLASLLSKENLKNVSQQTVTEVQLLYVRVYVKHRHDAPLVKRKLTAYYPTLPAIYTIADICRSELLLEIEGMAVVHGES